MTETSSPYDWLESDEPVLIYIADPMCSWCYGFAPELQKALERLDVRLELVMGGLRPGGTETMADLGSFLEHHWKEVEERTGQPFNHGIIGKAEFVLDTEPGCRAVVTTRTIDKEKVLPFFRAVQHAFYVENADMRSVETFVGIANNLEMDAKAFETAFTSEEMKYATRSDFQLSAEMGIQGFPSIILRHAGQLYLTSNGYRTAEDLLEVIKRIQTE